MSVHVHLCSAHMHFSLLNLSSVIYLLLFPLLLVLVFVFVCAAIFVLHLLLVSVFFIRGVLKVTLRV